MLLKLRLKNRQRRRWCCDDRRYSCGNTGGDGGVDNAGPMGVDDFTGTAYFGICNNRRFSDEKNRLRYTVAVPFDFPFRAQLTTAQFQFLEDVVHTWASVMRARVRVDIP